MSLDVTIGVKNAAFRSGLEQMRGQAQKFSGDLRKIFMGSLGGLGAAFSVGGILELAGRMREVKNEALRLGVSAESVQRIGKMARAADVDFEVLAKSINKVTLEASKAAGGNGESANLFARLRIDAKAFLAMNPEQRLVEMAAAYQRGGANNVAMLELLGERGTEIIPILARGPKALTEGLQEAEVQSNHTVDALARLDKMVQRLKGTGARLAAPIAGPAVQAVESYINVVSQKLKDLKDGVKDKDWQKLVSASDLINPLAVPKLNALAAKGYKKQGELDAKADAAPGSADPGTGDAASVGDPTKIAALKKQIAEEEAKNRVDALSGQARINELVKQRAELAKQTGKDEAANLEIKKQDLALEREIADLKKSQAEKLQSAKDKEAEVKEKQALAKMTPEQQRAYLEKKQADLFKQANDMEKAPALIKANRAAADRETAAADEAGRFAKDAKAHGKHGDYELYEQSKGISRRRAADLNGEADKLERDSDPAKAVELRTKAEEMQEQIDALKKSDDPKKAGPTAPDAKKDGDRQPAKFSVTATSLQRAGGGGRAYGTGVDEARRAREKTNQLLQKLVDASTKKDGAQKDEPVAPF